MLTIVETPTFSALWPDYWSDEELGEFCFWLAVRPDAGDVIQGSGGCRKVRWSREGKGKSSGVRVELTRFRGHLNVRFGGVHDGRQDGPVHTGV